jgi:type II secretion system protein J
MNLNQRFECCSASRAREGRRAVANIEASAFTLMEVMLALMVSAIVLAAIGGVFYSAIRLRDRTAAMLDESTPLHQALSFLRRDLQGALPPGGPYALAGDFKSEQLSGGIGQNFHLQFFTSTGMINDNAPWGEVQQVSYELRDPLTRTGGTGRELIRSINRNLLATGTQEQNDQFLLGNVQSLEFACYDGSDWRESWDTSLSDTNLPSAIRVRIQLASASGSQHPFEMIVPLLCQSRTNQTQSATQ